MDEHDREAWESLVRAHELRTGRHMAPEELERNLKRFTELRKVRKQFAWMSAFVNRQGTTMPDFNSLYRRKAELDGESP